MPPRQRRSRERIFLEILQLLHCQPCTKTEITYGLNLNFRAASQYIDRLTKIKAIVRMGRVWKVTPLGYALMARLDQILTELEEIL
ncbi:winged helix-turn-helix domain-containing protein [Candidatus Pacearchaeota archaeon]|jgi:predicted transcriptional regulator|nr:winged helix-turn-helix domain-containing protein [Candidatus Pacearchaeota archaeon]